MVVIDFSSSVNPDSDYAVYADETDNFVEAQNVLCLLASLLILFLDLLLLRNLFLR